MLGRDDQEGLHFVLGQEIVPLAAVARLHLELAVQLHQGGLRDVDAPVIGLKIHILFEYGDDEYNTKKTRPSSSIAKRAEHVGVSLASCTIKGGLYDLSAPSDVVDLAGCMQQAKGHREGGPYAVLPETSKKHLKVAISFGFLRVAITSV